MSFILKKLTTMIITLLVLSFLSFAAFEMVGDPVNTILGTNATPEAAAELRAQLGLDRPLLVRYGSWLVNFFRGDWGESYIYRIPVREMISEKFVITVTLTLMGFVLAVLLAIPIGIYTARREGQWIDRAITVLSQILMAIPPFFVAILLTILFGLLLKIFTPGTFVSYREDMGRFIGYMIFPAISIALPRVAMTVKMLRTTILGEMQKDYIRTAYSRGHSRQTALKAHAFKNGLLPVITFLAANMAEMLAGCIVIEQIFSVPGIGRLLMTSISSRDIPTVEAIVMILALWVMIVHFIGELVNDAVDPRLHG